MLILIIVALFDSQMIWCLLKVLMYYQNDWTRTWYDSGVWFEQNENMLLHDQDGNLVVSPVEYVENIAVSVNIQFVVIMFSSYRTIRYNHTFYAYDFTVSDAQAAWVDACMVLVDNDLCDGVFVDGYRGPAWRFELLDNCTTEFQTRWIQGAYDATAALADRLGPDRILFNNPYSAARYLSYMHKFTQAFKSG
jgi:hypothetical protein